MNRIDEIREKARASYGKEGEIEIPDDAQVSWAEGGAYVAAWVWVSDQNTPKQETPLSR